MDLGLALAGLFVGAVVGLTGMGGGALMTPMLVLFFGVQPLAAVSSDLVASAFMKPIGGAVHLRNGTVNKRLAGLLVIGSVPSAFAGVFVLARSATARRSRTACRSRSASPCSSPRAAWRSRPTSCSCSGPGARRGPAPTAPGPAPRPAPPGATVLVGIVGGLVVGMT